MEVEGSANASAALPSGTAISKAAVGCAVTAVDAAGKEGKGETQGEPRTMKGGGVSISASVAGPAAGRANGTGMGGCCGMDRDGGCITG